MAEKKKSTTTKAKDDGFEVILMRGHRVMRHSEHPHMAILEILTHRVETPTYYGFSKPHLVKLVHDLTEAIASMPDEPEETETQNK